MPEDFPPRRLWRLAKRRAGYWRLQRRLAGRRLLRAFAVAYPDAFFVEIGANDGDHHDHLRPFILSGQWRGIMVEPVPYVFARLKANYGHLGRIQLANVAIADRDGQLPFYHPAEVADPEAEQVPGWYHGLGSFSRETVLRHAEDIPDIEERIVSQDVACLTFDSLCERYGADRVDLLVVDTEGYDWEILRNIDFSKQRPRVIAYEHYHLSAEDQASSRRHLEGLGYETLEEGFDTFCLDTRPADGLTDEWRTLQPALPPLSAEEKAG